MYVDIVISNAFNLNKKIVFFFFSFHKVYRPRRIRCKLNAKKRLLMMTSTPASKILKKINGLAKDVFKVGGDLNSIVCQRVTSPRGIQY